MEEKKSEKSETEKKQAAALYMMAELGLEFAFIIGIPLLGFIYLGKWLDTKYQHHFFVIIGLLLALALSSFTIYKRILAANNMLK